VICDFFCKAKAMPNYFYTAKTYDGKSQTGTLYAKDVTQLAQNLKNEDMLLVKAVSAEDKKNRRFDWMNISFGVSSTEKIMMTRNLWIMFAAGLSLTKIFSILASQGKNPKVKNMMLDINERLNKGETFSDALAHYPKVFSELFLNMVKIGEESGTLESVFEILATHMERDHELRSKIKGALIYPAIVMATMGVMGIVISIFVLPKFTSFLLGMGIPLPIYTRILIGIGAFSQHYWYIVVFVPIVLVNAFLIAIKTKPGKFALDTFLINMPLLAPFIKKTNATVAIRSLSSLNASGISLVRSLEITAGTVDNVHFKKALNESIEKVKKGEKLSSALKSHARIFPFGAIDMMEVGEETGKTADVLKKLAEFYETEVIDQTKNFSVIIEPILIIILGLGVAFFAISIIAPMYSSFKSI
jgi:type IV pilus assembly protein PilC